MSQQKIVLAGVIVIEVVMALVLLPGTDHARIQRTDFLNFYAAATIVRQGHGTTLYTRATQDLALQAILGGPVAEYYLHPAFEAAALVPLTHLKIEHAFVVWTLINSALVGLLPLLLAGYIPFILRRPYLGWLGFAFPPVLVGLALGQDSILVMFVISAAYLLLTRRRDFLAGLLLAPGMIKFQYVLILMLLLLVARKFRLIAGFALGCVTLALVCVLVTGPAGVLQYVRFLHSFELHHGYGGAGLGPMLMALPAWFEALGWTSQPHLFGAIGSLVLLGLGAMCAGAMSTAEDAGLGFSLFLAIAIVATPYGHFQDVAILLPAIFLSIEAVRSGRIKGIRATLLLMSCLLLFLFPAILLMLGTHYFWYDQIYLDLPVFLLVIGTLATELWRRAQGGSRPNLAVQIY